MPDLNAVYRKYGDRAAFYVVYIQEAHPVDAWQLETNVKDNVLVASTTSTEERSHVAGLCLKNLGIEFPAILDGPDDAVERAYTAWPDRLYVIGTDGRVEFKSAAGPFGFSPGDVEAVLERLLGPGGPPQALR